jgi:hypothetical protein
MQFMNNTSANQVLGNESLVGDMKGPVFPPGTRDNTPGNNANGNQNESGDGDFSKLNPGSVYKGQTILDILFVTEQYIIFTTVAGPAQVTYYYNDDKCEGYISKIQKDLIKLIAALKLNNELAANYYYLASIYAVCLGGDPDGAKELISALYAQSSLGEEIRKKGKINYLTYCLGMALLAIAASLVFHYTLKNSRFVDALLYIKIATLGSVGGYISIAIKVSTTIYKFDKSSWLQILSATSRIFISMFSAVAIYIFIHSKLILGVFADVHSDSIYYAFALLAGFSETFIPDVFGVIEKQAKDKVNSPQTPPANQTN